MATVLIVSHGGKNLVWPPIVTVKPGETVIFKVVNTTAKVYFPECELFEETGTANLQGVGTGVVVALGASGGKLKVKSEQALEAVGSAASAVAGGPRFPRAYPYAVYCSCGGDFAEGHSSPIMIVEPPDGGVTPVTADISMATHIELRGPWQGLGKADVSQP
ncbi:MAG: hypothetical protein WAW06_05770 [bacterium]